jgi:signal transduction histidine kinase
LWATMVALLPARLRSVPRPGPADVALALLLAAGGLVELSVAPPSGSWGAAVLAALAPSLPLAWREIAPAWVVAVAAGGVVAAASFSSPDELPLLAWLAAGVGVYSLGENGSKGELIAGGAIAIVAYAGVGLLEYDSGHVVAGGVLALAALAVGRAVRVMGLETDVLEARAAELERDRDERARRAVAEERERIARELHDVIGHSISVMGVQAGAVRRVLDPELERERAALLAVERTGRDAVTEMRRLLGLLRSDDAAPAEAAPTLSRAHDLVSDFRRAGLDVELELEGDLADLPPGRSLAGFRILQEALTNALKHAPDAHVRVSLRRGPTQVEIEVLQDLGARKPGEAEPGQGLVGMRERVALYGGQLSVGPGADGGYEVRARLPLQAGEP